MGNILHLDQFALPTPTVFDPERFDMSDLLLQVTASFNFKQDSRVFVMGSCFAAEVRRALIGSGFAATDGGQGFKYNTFSMFQTLDWALNDSFDERFLAPLEDGRYLDGHRHPSFVFPTAASGALQHRIVLERVRDEILSADIVVLTLGLVEAWRDSVADVWLNETPPVKLLAQKNRFCVYPTTHTQNLDAFQALLLRLHEVNPACRVLCSVSPVPLKATFCGDDVLVANCYSKSTLRSVASEAVQCLRKDHGMVIDYFPAFELSTLRPRDEVWCKTIRNNEPDGRHVRRDFVDGVIMKLFLDSYVESTSVTLPKRNALTS
jgi:hypothetical protein